METLEKQELEEQEAIMPEGYGEGDDYFQEEDWGKGDKVEADARAGGAAGMRKRKKRREICAERRRRILQSTGLSGRADADGGFERMAGRNGPWRGVCRV